MGRTKLRVAKGDWVVLREDFGAGIEVVVRVELYSTDIKRGNPGIEYTHPNGTRKWAYLIQIVRKATESEIAQNHHLVSNDYQG